MKEDGGVAVFLGQTLGTVLAVEAQHAGAIQGDDQVTLEAERIQGPHPDQAVGAALAQAGEGLAPLGMFQEMVHGSGSSRLAALVGRVGLDQGQAQLGDFGQEAFEPAILELPLLDLGEQGLGHVGAAGFAVFFPGEVVTDGFVALGTAAGGLAAGAVDGDQGGGQDGALGLEPLLAGAEGALDQGGMGGRLHGLGCGLVPE